jgi:single-stranded-DNA-specific exonuclease
MKSPRWQFIPTDEGVAQALHEALGIDPIFCRLLAQRGVATFDEARAFFRATLDDLHDPFLIKDMDAAVQRLNAAMRRNERILLYGDYDVDGTTSVALMYTFLSNFYQNIDYYLPDREKEGYGVSLASVEYARETGVHLVVAMDCGIKGHKAIEQAKKYGIDFIVCDHHLPEGDLPDSVANLDPKRADCPYPFKELSGCGIAFKLAQALAKQNDKPSEELDDLLDLVAVSTACDIVPMVGENRILARAGLQRLNHSPRVGLWALMQRINRPFPLNVSDLVFGIGPLINAAGRLGDARDAVRLLLSADKNSALDNAGRLVLRNKERREVDYAMADEARRQFTAIPGWEQRRSIVLFNPEWHKGIIGIAASRMTETFHKPSVILTQSNDRAVGSARSVPGFDLYAALQDCEDLFHSYGGHAHAAGMQMPIKNVEAFAERFESIVSQNIAPENENPVLDICSKIRLDDITPKFWRILRQFEPFGPHNRNPVFYAENLIDTGQSRLLKDNHVRLSLRQADGNTIWKGVGFNLGDKFLAVKDQPFDMVFNLKAEQWQGQTTLNLHAKDFRKSES